ncbi:MAG: CopD family protein [Syntrophales bacterium]|jgi:predicted heme/steroid binding protein/uncharacterized membrane protein|nr:CopD family protein [Syntrophales bacterium]MDY0043033.1 multiheme c-type cytochrome [Syntrophales bacterium]
MKVSHRWFHAVFFAFLVLCIFSVCDLDATEQYARETGKGCTFCHQEPTGGPLATTGFAYIRNGYRYPIPERILDKTASLTTPLHKTIRFIVGYIHLLAAVVFFGAIFYIHIFVRPTRFSGGIPTHERILGLSCMAALIATGIYLTWFRIDRWEQFFDNTFGFMLFIKIVLFAMMIILGLTAVTFLHRKMRQEAAGSSGALSGEITGQTLGRYNGSEGNPAYVAVDSRVYDVTASPKWRGGRHFGKHTAGADLTAALKGAPHGSEVFENIPVVKDLQEGEAKDLKGTAHRIFVVFAYVNLALVFLILVCISMWRWGFTVPTPIAAEERPLSGTSCIECHGKTKPALVIDWKSSMHAKVGVDCYDCHRTDREGPMVNTVHLSNSPVPVATVVTPRRCAQCHPSQAEEFARSKHAHTLEIMWKIDFWLKDGMNNAVERNTGCYSCHGTEVTLVKGKPVAGSWPNVGIGRINPDGSKGSCSSCHTRHRFSIAEARKPEACDQCHLGPDHPQIEIYNESKHGTLYHAEGHQWTWTPEDSAWTAGRDFRAPTCAACHMSGTGPLSPTHDVTERIAWETQAPLTIRPQDFAPFPARTDWRTERSKMEQVCLQCHSSSWTGSHFENYDQVIENYNEVYYRPVRKLMDSLYDQDLLTRRPFFDEELEWEFYEFWHHEGRRARMGAAMMAPDYAWWHGFYELKHRYNAIVEKAEQLKKSGPSSLHDDFPGKYKGRSQGEKDQ